MKFSIALTIDNEVAGKSALIHSLAQEINEHIQKREYGDEIQEYLISLSIVNPPVGYEHLFKTFKPKYTDYKLRINKYTGERMEIVKQFHYSIKIDGDAYKYFLGASEISGQNLIASKILESMKNLELLPKKVKRFEKQRFISDLTTILKNKI